MTAQQIDSLGYVPIAGASKPIMFIVLRHRPYSGHTFIIWSHDGKEFTYPTVLQQHDKDIIKNKLRKSIDKR